MFRNKLRMTATILVASASVMVAAPAIASAEIQGGSTGSGSLSEAQCEGLGDLANKYWNMALKDLDDGNVPAVNNDLAAYDAVTNYGLSHGCFFTDPGRLRPPTTSGVTVATLPTAA